MTEKRNERRVVGLEPWLPWPLSAWRWFTEPVRAERLAALRIGLGLMLAIDILTTYAARAADFFGRGSLGGGDVFPEQLQAWWQWSLLAGVQEPAVIHGAILLWLLAALSLTVGLASRLSAAAAWLLAVSLFRLNLPIHNAGDMVRNIALFYLMLSPCGAVWSFDAWRRKRHSPPTGHLVTLSPSDPFIHPWALRLLFLQMVLIYFCNGLHKNVPGGDWRGGEAVYTVLANLEWARLPYTWQPMPYWATKQLTWMIFIWEIGFPVWVALRWTRIPALCLGAAFHLGLGIFMEIAFFPWYMLCLYLPLVPWERLTDRRRAATSS